MPLSNPVFKNLGCLSGTTSVFLGVYLRVWHSFFMKIFICTHKSVPLPNRRWLFPVFVNGSYREDLPRALKDDCGDNISKKNPSFCELTVLYWAWKNDDDSIVGFCHYRRYFGRTRSKVINRLMRLNPFSKWGLLARPKDFEKSLKDSDIVLPEPIIYDCSLFDQYCCSHHKSDLLACRETIAELFPDYLESFDRTMKQNRSYEYNAFVTKRPVFAKYCSWLFKVLFALEKKIDISQYDAYQKRVFGFLAERLLNVFIDKNNLRVSEMSMLFQRSR